MGAGKGRARRAQVAKAAKPGFGEVVKSNATTLTPGEIAACRKLTLGVEGYMLEAFNDVLSKHRKETGVVWRILSSRGRLAAWALLIDSHDGNPLVLDVFVRESEQRQGLGMRLAKEAARYTRRPIEVEATDEPAYQLYKRIVHEHKHVSLRDEGSPYSYVTRREEELYEAAEAGCCSVVDGVEDVHSEEVDASEGEMVRGFLEELKSDYPVRYTAKRKAGKVHFTVTAA